MNRRSFLGFAPLGLAPALQTARAQTAPPNIVVILADDLGYGDLSCQGASAISTPHMDRIAREGVRFTDAHSGSAVCTPTRYGLMTGRYAWRSRLKRGVLQGYDEPLLEPGRVTTAGLLRDRGYTTACVGKWHLGLAWARKDPSKPPTEDNIDFTRPITDGPLQHGFDRYYGISASLDMAPYVFIDNNRCDGLPTALQEAIGVGGGGEPGTQMLLTRSGPREPRFTTEGVLPKLEEKAIDFIDRNAARPFFLYMPLASPHTPVVPTAAFRGKSKAGIYGDFVQQTDAAVGNVLKALADRNVLDRTLVIVTSDNGSSNKPLTEFNHNSNAPWRGRKSDIWDGGHRIPFLARWPERIKPGTVSDETICLTDLMGTFAAMTGNRLPADSAEDSFNIMGAMRGGRLQRTAVVHHSVDGMFAVREKPWKLVLGRGSGGWSSKGSPDDPPGQLYNVLEDPAEENNVYARHPDVVARLTATLDRFEKDGRSR